MRPELETMTRSELRAFIVANPNDIEAFHLWVDGARPISPLYPAAKTKEAIAEMAQIVREKVEELDRRKAS